MAKQQNRSFLSYWRFVVKLLKKKNKKTSTKKLKIKEQVEHSENHELSSWGEAKNGGGGGGGEEGKITAILIKM